MKTAVIILIGRIIQVIISFVSLKVITNYLNKENVAYFFLFTSLMNYFGLSMISPVGQYFNRKVHSWAEQGVLMNRMLIHFCFVLGVSIISIPTVMIMSSMFNILEGINIIQLASILSISILFNTLVTTVVPTFNMLNYRIHFVALSNMWLLLSLILSIIFVYVWGDNFLNWFLGQFVAQAFVGIISLFLLMKKLGEKISVSKTLVNLNHINVKKIWSFCFPLMVATLLMWIATDSFRFVLEKTHSLAYVGLFSVGFAIAQRISFAVESIAQQIFYPYYYKEITSENFEERNNAWLKLFYSTVPVYIFTAIITIVTAPFLINLFSGKDYEGAAYFVCSGAFFHLFRKLTALFAMSAHSEMKTEILIFPYFVGAIFSSLGVYFYGKASFYMPAIIIALGSIAMMICMVLNTRKTLKIRFDLNLLKQALRSYIIW